MTLTLKFQGQSLKWSYFRNGRVDWHGAKEFRLIIHNHDCDLWVTIKGWVDVPDSDRGDFRRLRAVDISIFSAST